MDFTLQPEYSTIKKRYEAFWQREIIDRPPVSIILEKEHPQSLPRKHYPDLESRWLDVQFRAMQEAVQLSNRIYLGDALPVCMPNMGPEIFSAWCGCGYGYGEDTTWSEPVIKDWNDDISSISFDPEHPLFLKTIEYTKALIEESRVSSSEYKFIVGLTDFHPGGDHLAALRDPANLAMDLIDNLEEVKKLLAASTPQYFDAYDRIYSVLKTAEMPSTSWIHLISDGKFYIPSNDFSCMISTDMFEEVFLPGIIEECRFLDHSIYHLDGPGALRHLDLLLEIPELDAVQWVPGAGNEDFPRWVHVYQKIQAAGKGMQVENVRVEHLDLLFESLRPEGLFIRGIDGLTDPETAKEVLRRIEAWK